MNRMIESERLVLRPLTLEAVGGENEKDNDELISHFLGFVFDFFYDLFVWKE